MYRLWGRVVCLPVGVLGLSLDFMPQRQAKGEAYLKQPQF
jgi:hypothetical protein